MEQNNKEKFLSLCREKITRDGINELLEWLETTDFFSAPSSTKFHSNYEGGLCEHSILVYEQLVKLNELFNCGYDEEQIALTSLFHDLCKIYFYKLGSRNVKNEYGVWEKKTVWEIEDQMPLGHGEKSVILLQKFIKLSLEEAMAIRYHMGGFDNAVKGGDYGLSKAQEKSKLVTLLHVADLISSNIFEKTIK